MKAQDSLAIGIVRGLARLRMRFGMLLLIAALTVIAIAVLTGLAPAPVARNATGSDGSLAAERRAEHQWLAERNYAIATARQRLPVWNEGAMETAPAAASDSVDPAVQSATDYLHVHARVDMPVEVQSVPDPAVQSVMDYLRAHGSDASNPAASVADYLHVHARVDMPVDAQSVPDAAVQGVSDYLRAHGSGNLPAAQTQRSQRLLELNESLYPSQPRFYAPCCDPTDRGQ